ncbi:MAG TPA: hypothetical protein VHA06_17880 [Candidatus Angelobacter sp.]|jgi:hypothetical protein|nr:hypothetical protein [Candidatus Angelobacter sp.]
MTTVKAVHVDVMAQDNRSLIKRYRFQPPNDPKTGNKTKFTSIGIQQVLENFVKCFERDNPDHKYRLVELAGARFRLVHEVIPCTAPDCKKPALSDKFCRKHLKEAFLAEQKALAAAAESGQSNAEDLGRDVMPPRVGGGVALANHPFFSMVRPSDPAGQTCAVEDCKFSEAGHPA